MKQIKITLTRKDGEEILSGAEPSFAFAVSADRIVIDDRRDRKAKNPRLGHVKPQGTA